MGFGADFTSVAGLELLALLWVGGLTGRELSVTPLVFSDKT